MRERPPSNRGGRKPAYPLGRQARVCRPCRQVTNQVLCPSCGKGTRPAKVFNDPHRLKEGV
jgi:hypothetical protein